MLDFIKKYKELGIDDYIYYTSECFVTKIKSGYELTYNLRKVVFNDLNKLYSVLWLFGYED